MSLYVKEEPEGDEFGNDHRSRGEGTRGLLGGQRLVSWCPGLVKRSSEDSRTRILYDNGDTEDLFLPDERHKVLTVSLMSLTASLARLAVSFARSAVSVNRLAWTVTRQTMAATSLLKIFGNGGIGRGFRVHRVSRGDSGKCSTEVHPSKLRPEGQAAHEHLCPSREVVVADCAGLNEC
ncbi:hypothetical protein CYMTET_24621 [Cymbomonas tetramitiformis]|uniref:Uncharacterized protein n=1 Tax=Cymbomonas tetramitiformis TaxID=36881 RepID=A0AAE0KZS5_9CHLO|nr:hypothetical protein CYMTET_24621 [Cymbomonas tetramitiformis]